MSTQLTQPVEYSSRVPHVSARDWNSYIKDLVDANIIFTPTTMTVKNTLEVDGIVTLNKSLLLKSSTTNPNEQGWYHSTTTLLALVGGTANDFYTKVVENKPYKIYTNNLLRITVAADGAVSMSTSLNINTTTTITGMIDDDSMATASASLAASSESIKVYIDTENAAQELVIVGNSGTGSVLIDSQTLTVAGGTNITSVAGSQTVTLNLNDNVDLAGTLDVTGIATFDSAVNSAGDITIIKASSDGIMTVRGAFGQSAILKLQADVNGNPNVSWSVEIDNSGNLTMGNGSVSDMLTISNSGKVDINTPTLTVATTPKFGVDGDVLIENTGTGPVLYLYNSTPSDASGSRQTIINMGGVTSGGDEGYLTQIISDWVNDAPRLSFAQQGPVPLIITPSLVTVTVDLSLSENLIMQAGKTITLNNTIISEASDVITVDLICAGSWKFDNSSGNAALTIPGDPTSPSVIGNSADNAGAKIYGDLVLPKASGNGIKVDIDTPTFGFADLKGDQFIRNQGPTKPTLASHNGAVKAWQFGNGDEAYLTYHIEHDHVLNTNIFLHIHWSQTSATATGGTIDFKYTAEYAKGHNQASGSTFTATPITGTFSSIDINDGAAGLNQRQQHLTEIIISGESLTAALFAKGDLEPDGVIELTLEMVTNNLTNSGSVLDPFIHYADIHYQTTGVIGTKSKTPNFYT